MTPLHPLLIYSTFTYLSHRGEKVNRYIVTWLKNEHGKPWRVRVECDGRILGENNTYYSPNANNSLNALHTYTTF